MKKIEFNLTKNFKLIPVSANQVFEFENNSSKIIIHGTVEEGFIYKLYKAQDGENVFVTLDRTEDGLEYVVSNAFLKKAGEIVLQIGATDGDLVYESNQVKLTIGKMIDASLQPTPEEISEIDKLLAKAELLAEKAEELETLNVEELPDGINISYNGIVYEIRNGRDGIDGIDGVDGKDGRDGVDGSNGFSPLAKVERITNGAKITITDKDGTTEASVYDGQGGSGDVTKAYVDEQNALQNATIENHETRIEELESKPSGSGVSDVQIDGTSIVVDGVANIPVAGKISSQLGVVFANDTNSSGIGIHSDGHLYIRKASNSDIDKRQLYDVITPRNIDYAVKSAMCDGKGAEWTDAEKVEAQKRIGILSSEGVTF